MLKHNEKQFAKFGLIEVFEKEYAKLINDAVDSPYHIPTNKKTTKDFVIANFQNEPLRK